MSIYLVAIHTMAILDHTSILHFTLYLLCEEYVQAPFKAVLSSFGLPEAEKQINSLTELLIYS